MEAQPTTMRRDEDPQYRDDPDFDHLAEQLSDQLFTLTSNISRLSNQIALLGTKRDTERVRERVHNLLEETRTGFRDVGEGIKQIQTWEDVNVCHLITFTAAWFLLTSQLIALPEMDTAEAIVRIQGHLG